MLLLIGQWNAYLLPSSLLVLIVNLLVNFTCHLWPLLCYQVVFYIAGTSQTDHHVLSSNGNWSNDWANWTQSWHLLVWP